MSAPSESKKQSAASRYLFLFLLGLVIGAIGIVVAMRAWESRKTPQDRWHDAVMTIGAVHKDRLDKSVQANRCTATDLIPPLQSMRSLANDLEPAFPDLADDPRFRSAAGTYRARLDAALAKPPGDCAAARTTVENIGKACAACHQDFAG